MSTAESIQAPAVFYVNMESVNRISKFPVVESTIQTATTLYSRVKDYNSLTQWTFSTAENTVNKAVEITKPYVAPVVPHLEGPFKKVDDLLCNGLDYVEKKVPAVKLPPGQMYEGAKDVVNNAVGPAVESVKTIYEPTVESAKQYLEPAVQNAKTIVEPFVQPVIDKAYALKEYGAEKLDEFLHPENNDELECEVCAAGNVSNGGPESYY